MTGMLLREQLPSDPDLSAMLTAAFTELVEKYGRQGRSPVRADARYFVAIVAGRCVGCGALQPAGARTAELKRMYVDPSSRGQGLGRALLAELEDQARRAGYTALRFATGVRQPEAIALYESSGYEPIEPYGKYVHAPLTRCYQKTLSGRLATA